MDLLFYALPVMYAKFLSNHSDTMLLIFQKVLKFLLFLFYCIVTPLLKLQFFKRRKQLPLIKNRLLLISGSEIARKIRRKEISSEKVIRAYIERCRDVNPIINAIVDTRFDAAIEEAIKVDKFLECTTKTEEELALELPLLGVPITVKGSIAVEGLSHAVGLKKKRTRKAAEDAVVVKKAREAGAIILLVSNTPELCLFWETTNKITGTTWNPYNNTRISGGSSGGEAALLGAAASVISLASDIAGSARIPAMFCGVFGHKPTARSISCKGHTPDSSDENWPRYFTISTMVRYVEDLPLIMKIICQPEATHHFERKVPLRDIKFFYLDHCCGTTNSIDKDMKQAIQKLRTYIETKHRLEVKKAHLPEMKFAFNIAVHLLLNMDVDGVIEEVEPGATSKILLEVLKYIFCLSPYTFSTICYHFTKWVFRLTPRSVLRKMIEKRKCLRDQFEELLGDNGVLIFPTFVSAAGYQYQSYANVVNYTYQMIYNVLGLPVTQCPIGLNKNGLPVGVQIVANAGNDHLTITVAEEIEKAFGGWQQIPLPELKVFIGT